MTPKELISKSTILDVGVVAFVKGFILTHDAPPSVDLCKPSAGDMPTELTYTFPVASQRILVQFVRVLELGSKDQVSP